VFTVRDGRIISVREYMDTLYARDTAFGVPRSGGERAGGRQAEDAPARHVKDRGGQPAEDG
jgi:hypothetical protein